ncbi:hypothetical protein EON67_08315 [archaeon]|nr:MAG: hypothetical protein EON67_08315 [archaeon]
MHTVRRRCHCRSSAYTAMIARYHRVRHRALPCRAADLQYKNVRADYLGALWNVINWGNVESRLVRRVATPCTRRHHRARTSHGCYNNAARVHPCELVQDAVKK